MEALLWYLTGNAVLNVGAITLHDNVAVFSLNAGRFGSVHTVELSFLKGKKEKC